MRSLRSRRGSVMVHVLVTSVVAMVVAAGLLRLVMMRYVAIQRMQDGGAGKRKAEAAVAAVNSHWSVNGNCTQPPNFDPPSGAAPCGCTLVGTAGGPFDQVRVETSVAPGLVGACKTKVCTEWTSGSCPP